MVKEDEEKGGPFSGFYLMKCIYVCRVEAEASLADPKNSFEHPLKY